MRRRFLLLSLLPFTGLSAQTAGQATLIKAVQKEIVSADGKVIGTATIPAGTKVTISSVSDEEIMISREGETPFKVPKGSVDSLSTTPPPPVAAAPIALQNAGTTPGASAPASPKVSPVSKSSPQQSALSAEAVNKALGMDLFGNTSLWEEGDSEVAARLKLPQETKTSYESGFGYEPQGKKLVLGAECFSLYLQGFKGKVGRVLILFANKGDIRHYASAEDLHQLQQQAQEFGKSENYHPAYSAQMIQKYETAIRNDQTKIAQNLTKLFGEGTPVHHVKTSWMSEEGTKWGWKGTSFFLFSPRNEYLTLRIEPSSVADDLESGRKDFAAAKDVIASRVRHRPNGDVIIEDIPMVNQGAKGYCVDATLERMLRYYNIQADMNMLAMAGRTDAGGANGTSFDNIFPIINELVRNAGGTLNQRQFTGKISDIKEAIDSGKPIIWGLFSSREFNARMAERTPRRKSVNVENGDWEKWNRELAPTRSTARTLPQQGPHACMIIGYNEKTREIALSDSWGPSYQERWMTEEEAKAIAQGNMATIGW